MCSGPVAPSSSFVPKSKPAAKVAEVAGVAPAIAGPVPATPAAPTGTTLIDRSGLTITQILPPPVAAPRSFTTAELLDNNGPALTGVYKRNGDTSTYAEVMGSGSNRVVLYVSTYGVEKLATYTSGPWLFVGTVKNRAITLNPAESR